MWDQDVLGPALSSSSYEMKGVDGYKGIRRAAAGRSSDALDSQDQRTVSSYTLGAPM